MAQLWAGITAWGRKAQPIVVAWLAIALVLPTLLGLVPGAQASPVDQMLQLSELQLCAQLGHLPDDAKAPKGQHHHDCPCCLPDAVGLSALAPLDPALLPVPAWHGQKLALSEFTSRLFARQPFRFAPARAPPAFPSI